MMNRYVKSNSSVVCKFTLAKAVCMETFSTLPQLGRFTLRDEGKTIAIGKVTKIISLSVCFALCFYNRIKRVLEKNTIVGSHIFNTQDC